MGKVKENAKAERIKWWPSKSGANDPVNPDNPDNPDPW